MIQSLINRHLSKEENYQRTISLEGKSGSIALPHHCCLTLRNCSVGEITTEDNCTLILVGCVVSGDVILGNKTVLTIEDTECAGKLSMRGGSAATHKRSNFAEKVEIKGSTRVDSYNCTYTGPNPSLEISEYSTFESRNDSFESVVAVQIKTGSTGRFYDSEIAAGRIGVSGDGQGTSLSFRGGKIVSGEVALMAENDAVFDVVGVNEIILGSLSAVVLMNSSMTASGCVGFVGEEKSIEAVSSKCKIREFETINSRGSIAIVSVDSNIKIWDGSTISSEGSDAISCTNSDVDLSKIKDIIGKGGNGIRSDGNNKVTIWKVDNILGQQNCGISGGDDERYDIKECVEIKGETAEGIRLGSECTLTISSVESIEGKDSDGIRVGNRCQAQIKNVSRISGRGHNGWVSGDYLNAILERVDRIRGEDGDAVVLGENSTWVASKVLKLQGLNGNGMNVGGGSKLRIRDFDDIVGERGSGINVDSSELSIENGGSILGIIGYGIHQSGKNNVLTLRNITLITGLVADGVRLAGGSLDITDCGSIAGAGNGLVLTEKSDGKVSRMDSLSGGETAGAVVMGESSLSIHNTTIIAGASSGADCQQSNLYLYDVDILVGAADSARSAAGHLLLQRCSLITDLNVVDGGFLEASECQIGRSVTVDASDSTLNDVSVVVNVLLSGSGIHNHRNVGVVGELSVDGSSMVEMYDVSVAVKTTLSGCAARLSHCSGAILIISGGSIILMMPSYGLVDYQAGTLLTMSDNRCRIETPEAEVFSDGNVTVRGIQEIGLVSLKINHSLWSAP